LDEMLHNLKFINIYVILFKGRVHCFSMQVVLKCFLLNPEKKKNWRRFIVLLFEKNAPLIQKNDVIKLGYSNNQLIC